MRLPLHFTCLIFTFISQRTLYRSEAQTFIGYLGQVHLMQLSVRDIKIKKIKKMSNNAMV